MSQTQDKPSFPIPLEDAQRVTYEDEWLDNVIRTAKYVMEELAKQTFKRYREIGKLILESGYRKGAWKDKHKEKFYEEIQMSDDGLLAVAKKKIAKILGRSQVDSLTAVLIYQVLADTLEKPLREHTCKDCHIYLESGCPLEKKLFGGKQP